MDINNTSNLDWKQMKPKIVAYNVNTGSELMESNSPNSPQFRLCKRAQDFYEVGRHMGDKPQMWSMRNVIDLQLSHRVPFVSLLLAEVSFEQSRYFYMLKSYKGCTPKELIVGFTGEFDFQTFQFGAKKFLEICKLEKDIGSLDVHGCPKTGGPMSEIVMNSFAQFGVIRFVAGYVLKNVGNKDFWMKMADVELPEGYEYSTLTPSEVDIVLKFYRPDHAQPGADIQLRQVLEYLPSVAIRYKGEVVGCVMNSESGQSANLWVHHAHRGQLLRTALLTELYKEMYRQDIKYPHAFICSTNSVQVNFLEEDNWTRDKEGNPSYTFVYFMRARENAKPKL